MQYRTVVERIGERLGDIDWSYNFRPHFDCRCTDDATKDRECAKYVENLRLLEEAFKTGRPLLASIYGGWPRIWKRVLNVGMYDGWPYWRPVPSVMLESPLGGGEWQCFSSLTGITIDGRELDWKVERSEP